MTCQITFEKVTLWSLALLAIFSGKQFFQTVKLRGGSFLSPHSSNPNMPPPVLLQEFPEPPFLQLEGRWSPVLLQEFSGHPHPVFKALPRFPITTSSSLSLKTEEKDLRAHSSGFRLRRQRGPPRDGLSAS